MIRLFLKNANLHALWSFLLLMELMVPCKRLSAHSAHGRPRCTGQKTLLVHNLPIWWVPEQHREANAVLQQGQGSSIGRQNIQL
ncbi:hypothetical protein BJV82DRAFT_594985, partial [Fennellomyces sp. T-0311]